MKLGEKKSQNNKDYENLIMEEADIDIRKNYNNKYKKGFKNNINKDIDLDNNISSKEKEQIIKRDKKITLEKKDNSNNLFNFHSGIRRTINDQEYLSKNLLYSNTFSKSNFISEPKETYTLDNSESKVNNYIYTSFNKSKYDLPRQREYSIKMFWYDAIEETLDNRPNVIFFGKIYEPHSKSFLSISVIIKDIYRTVFILPKPKYETDEQIQKVYEEFEGLRKKRFNYIKEYRCKIVEKKYCFELPVEYKEFHKVIKIKYKAEYGTIPSNLNQKNFDYIFGRKSSLLENILLKLKIKGPCWLKIKNFTENNLDLLRTWTYYELSLDDLKNIEVISKNSNCSDISIPPMKIISISTQRIRIKNENEIYCICCSLKEGYHIEDVKGLNKLNDSKSLVFTRKIDNKMSIFKNNNLGANLDSIPDLNNIFKLKELLKIEYLYLANDEKNLLIDFITKISELDPDIIVGHNLNNIHLNLILSRISFYKSSDWTKLSHFKRSVIPNHLRGIYNSDYCRKCLSGRLLCDTFENTKEILFKKTNYDLRTIFEKHFNLKILPEVEPTNILINLNSVNDIKHILQVTMEEAYYTLIVMDKFQILSLTLNLASIATCLWAKSLQCNHASCFEMLLLHQFYEQNYLFPDKYQRADLIKVENSYTEDSDNDDRMNEGAYYISKNQRRKPHFLEGIEFELHPGLYDEIILVMDFKSLFSSIIQEYNISFETVKRKASQSFKEENNRNNNKKDSIFKDYNDDKLGFGKLDDEKKTIIKGDEEEDDEDKVEEIMFRTHFAILPSIISNLVGERRNVKNQKEIEKDKFKFSLLEIKQKSLEISANSLYIYLISKNSRFLQKK